MAVDATIVGAGPNGLAAAVALALAGRRVRVLEANDRPGGGARTAELTVPGFLHDLCSGVHPMAVGSPFFRSLPLERHGLAWIHPDVPLAHPMDDGPAVLLHRSLDRTAEALGEDGEAWQRLVRPLADRWDDLAPEILGPIHWPSRPLLLARFGWDAIGTARSLVGGFRTAGAKALFAGTAAHAILPLDMRPSGAFGIVLAAAAHAVGWPVPRGGSQAIADALVGILAENGGTLQTRHRVVDVSDVPGLVLLDLTPRQVARIAGEQLPARYLRKLARFRYGPGVFKMDWALDGPIPWRDPAVGGAGTVHLGGTWEEIATSERDAWEGRHTERPFVLLAQPTCFDATRAPEGRHVAWGYCHVPHGSTLDRTEAVEAQVERFAPGFRERILARRAWTTADLEASNGNLVGGDINGGAPTLGQMFLGPALRSSPYTTPNPRILLCSASTPPGGGVHGMCGYHAARQALRR